MTEKCTLSTFLAGLKVIMKRQKEDLVYAIQTRDMDTLTPPIFFILWGLGWLFWFIGAPIDENLATIIFMSSVLGALSSILIMLVAIGGFYLITHAIEAVHYICNIGRNYKDD